MDNSQGQDVFTYDLEQAVTDGDAKSVHSAADALHTYFRRYYRHPATEKLKHDVAYQKRITEWLVQKYTAEENIDYFAGVFIGLLYALEVDFFAHGLEEQAGAALDAVAKDIPHFQEILYEIEAQDGIRHGKLAELVGIDRSTLTGIMDRIILSDAVIFSRPGKFKYYYLTELGKRYCNIHRRQHNLKQDKAALTNAFVALMDQSRDPAELVGELMKTLYSKKRAVPVYSTVSIFEEINNSFSKGPESARAELGLIVDHKREDYIIDNVLIEKNTSTSLDKLIIHAERGEKNFSPIIEDRQEA